MSIFMKKITFFSMILTASVCLQAADFPQPSVACNTMAGYHMPAMNTWKDYGYGMGYGCNSSYLDIGSASSGLANNIAYYVDGDSHKVNQVKLVLNVNQRLQENEAKTALVRASHELVEKSLGKKLPSEIVHALNSGGSLVLSREEINYEVRRSDWPTGKGYEIHFIIR